MSSATAQAWPENDGGINLRLRFRNWRRSRPFWGGLLAMIAGVPILYFPYAELNLAGMTVSMATTAGAGSLIIGILMMCLGLTAWFQPLVRIFCGVATTLLSLISIPVSNLGGFGFGLVLGLMAGGLLMAWAPLKPVALVEDAPAAAAPAEFTGEAPVETTQPLLPAQQTPAEAADSAAPAADPGEQR
ncbi:DUF6114 domain-containing protein [Streptomyces sp. NRRL B-24484]|uniref:DUF6114 domain-containing protein n=1 Tax=Streptomyces sp. NRRL B-24484 TaxID=1463833 RepID=UPI0007C4D130|nr:DUF6114 domain-containing protein [Streptomyces sp. NRRL B-24484]